MARCWNCGNSLYEEHGIEFINSARFVVTSDWFWEQKLATIYIMVIMSKIHQEDY